MPALRPLLCATMSGKTRTALPTSKMAASFTKPPESNRAVTTNRGNKSRDSKRSVKTPSAAALSEAAPNATALPAIDETMHGSTASGDDYDLPTPWGKAGYASPDAPTTAGTMSPSTPADSMAELSRVIRSLQMEAESAREREMQLVRSEAAWAAKCEAMQSETDRQHKQIAALTRALHTALQKSARAPRRIFTPHATRHSIV